MKSFGNTALEHDLRIDAGIYKSSNTFYVLNLDVRSIKEMKVTSIDELA